MLAHTLRTAVRVLMRRKFFTAVSLFGVAVTLVVLVVTAALLHHSLGTEAPEVHGGRSLGVYWAAGRGDTMAMAGNPGYRLLDRCARDLPGVETATFFVLQKEVVAYRDDARVPLWLKRTDGAFWRALSFRFLEGGPYTEADDAAANAVAVVSDSTRRKMFGEAKGVGRTIDLDGQSFRVVGVVEDVSFLRMVPFADVWVPLRTARNDAWRKEWVGDALALLVARSRSDLPAIREEYRRRVKALDLAGTGFNSVESEAETFPESVARELIGPTRGRAVLLVGAFVVAGLLFMVLPALNLVNLNLSRILERASEIGVRKAFGATSAQLVVQFVTENLVLTLAGGALGFVAAGAVLAAINRSGLIPSGRLVLDLPVFAWGLLAAIVFGVVSGAYPAFRMSRLHPVEALKGGAS